MPYQPAYPQPFNQALDLERRDIFPNGASSSNLGAQSIDLNPAAQGNLFSCIIDPYDVIQEYTLNIYDIGANKPVLRCRNWIQNNIQYQEWFIYRANGIDSDRYPTGGSTGFPVTGSSAYEVYSIWENSELPFIGGQILRIMIPLYLPLTNRASPTSTTTGIFSTSASNYVKIPLVNNKNYKWSITLKDNLYNIVVVDNTFIKGANTQPYNVNSNNATETVAGGKFSRGQFTYVANNDFIRDGNRLETNSYTFTISKPMDLWDGSNATANMTGGTRSIPPNLWWEGKSLSVPMPRVWKAKIVGYRGVSEGSANGKIFFGPIDLVNNVIPAGCISYIFRVDMNGDSNIKGDIASIARNWSGFANSTNFDTTTGAKLDIRPDPPNATDSGSRTYSYQPSQQSDGSIGPFKTRTMDMTGLYFSINNGAEIIEEFTIKPLTTSGGVNWGSNWSGTGIPSSISPYYEAEFSSPPTVNAYFGNEVEIGRRYKMVGLTQRNGDPSTNWSLSTDFAMGDYYRILTDEITSVEYFFSGEATPPMIFEQEFGNPLEYLPDGTHPEIANAFLSISTQCPNVSSYYWELWDNGPITAGFSSNTLLERTDKIFQGQIIYQYEGLQDKNKYTLTLVVETNKGSVFIKTQPFTVSYGKKYNLFKSILSYDTERLATRLELDGKKIIRGDPEIIDGATFSEVIFDGLPTAISKTSTSVTVTINGIKSYLVDFSYNPAGNDLSGVPINNSTQFIRQNCYLNISFENTVSWNGSNTIDKNLSNIVSGSKTYRVTGVGDNTVTFVDGSSLTQSNWISQFNGKGVKLVVREEPVQISDGVKSIPNLGYVGPENLTWGGNLSYSVLDLSQENCILIRTKSKWNFPLGNEMGNFNDWQTWSLPAASIPTGTRPLCSFTSTLGNFALRYDSIFFYILYPTESRWRKSPIYTDSPLDEGGNKTPVLPYRTAQNSAMSGTTPFKAGSQTSSRSANTTALKPERNRLYIIDFLDCDKWNGIQGQEPGDSGHTYAFGNNGGHYVFTDEVHNTWWNIVIFANEVAIFKDYGSHDYSDTTLPLTTVDGGTVQVYPINGVMRANGQMNNTIKTFTVYEGHDIEIFRATVGSFGLYPDNGLYTIRNAYDFNMTGDLQVKFKPSGDFTEVYDWGEILETSALASFKQDGRDLSKVSTDASPPGGDEQFRDGFLVYRTEYDLYNPNIVKSYKQICKMTNEQAILYDYMIANDRTYSYSIFPLVIDPIDPNKKFTLKPLITQKFTPNWQPISIYGTNLDQDIYQRGGDLWLGKRFENYVVDKDQIWHFRANLSTPLTSTINADRQNFEGLYRYPKVNLGQRNYRSGSFSTLIGDTTSKTVTRFSMDGGSETLTQYGYTERFDFLEKFQEFAHNGKIKLIRFPDGNLMPCDITLSSIESSITTSPRLFTFSIEWVQLKDPNRISVVEKGLNTDMRMYYFNYMGSSTATPPYSDAYAVRTNKELQKSVPGAIDPYSRKATSFYRDGGKWVPDPERPDDFPEWGILTIPPETNDPLLSTSNPNNASNLIAYKGQRPDYWNKIISVDGVVN